MIHDFTQPSGCRELVHEFNWPSEALWRAIELDVLQRIEVLRPAIDVGFGSCASARAVYGHLEAGLDANPRAKRRADAAGVFDAVYCADISNPPQPARGAFMTVICNSVLEHIKDLDAAMRGCVSLLQPGGRLVVTVPTDDMNRNLLSRSPRYVSWRQRRLQHLHLIGVEDWERIGRTHGLVLKTFVPYLSAHQTRMWDCVDLPATISIGPFHISTALRLAGRAFLPRAVRRWVAASLGRRIATAVREPGSGGNHEPPSCVALLFEKTGAAF